MNEHELKSAMQDAMVASSPPPPMSPEAAVEAGQAARRRRKAVWGGTVAGVAVVAIAVGAVLVPQLTGSAGIEAGKQPSGPQLTTVVPPSSPTVDPSVVTFTGKPSGTETPWPDGQTDRTATSGPRADKSVRILNDLGAALPAGFQAVDKEPAGQESHGKARHTQSQFRDYDGDRQIWEYLARTPVVQQGTSGVGKLWIQVTTRPDGDPQLPPPCALAERAWAIKGTCEERTVDGKRIGFITATPGEQDADLDELVIYQHGDGTTVLVGQAAGFRGLGHPPLAGQPFTQEQLIAQAADAKYHLD